MAANNPGNLRFTLISLTLLLLLALALAGLWLQNQADGMASVALPKLGTAPLRLRVAHVVNARFAALSESELSAVLSRTRQLVAQHFQRQVEFGAPQQVTIEDFFKLRKPDITPRLQKAIVNPLALASTDRDRMRKGVYEALGAYWDERGSVIDYARPYLTVSFEGNDYYQLSNALVDTLLTRLEYWREQLAEDGRPVLDGSPYNEWVWWDTVGYGDVPYDVVITNQLVASAEIYGMDVHSCIRGGITAGTTSYSKSARLQAYSFVSAFQILNDNEVLALLRNESHYSSEQVIEYVATVLTHELGHMLLHLGHPFGNKHCIMSPTPLLHYRSWVDALDGAQCTLDSEAQMSPGVARIDYRPDW